MNTQTIASKGDTVITFQMTANDSVLEPTKTYLRVIYRVDNYADSAFFLVKIGDVAEDWETGLFTNMEWQNNSTTPWTITMQTPYEGTYCAKSGAISHSENTTLSISYIAEVSDTLSFYYKVSSEENYDKLIFRIDGSKKDEWSGNIGWTRAAYPVNAGTHTFTWVYSKDNYMSAGKDCAYIDLISFPCGVLNSDLAVDDFTQNAMFSVWPNPAIETVHVQISELSGNQYYTYQLYDLAGKLMQGGRLTDNYSEIDIRNLVTGTYLLKVEDSQHRAQTTKIIKK